MRNSDAFRWIIIILIVGLAASKIVEFNKEKQEEKEAFNQISQEDKDFAMNYLLNNKIKDITKFSDNVDATTKYCKILTEYEILNNHVAIVAGHLYEEKIKLNETTRSNWNHATDIWKNASKKLNKLGEKIRSEKNINIGEICK